MTKSDLENKNKELIETVDNLNEVIKTLNDTIEDLSKDKIIKVQSSSVTTH